MGSYSGELALNIGANIGQAAHHLAPRFEQVIAFEPCWESFAVLDAEAPPNVQCRLVAVSDHVGELTLTESSRSILTGQLTTGGGLQWGEQVGERTIPCVTVDALGLDPDLIQVDTEGHEVLVLTGAVETVRRCRPQLFVEVHHQSNQAPIRELFPDYEWEVITYPNVRPHSMLVHHYWMAGHAAV